MGGQVATKTKKRVWGRKSLKKKHAGCGWLKVGLKGCVTRFPKVTFWLPARERHELEHGNLTVPHAPPPTPVTVVHTEHAKRKRSLPEPPSH